MSRVLALLVLLALLILLAILVLLGTTPAFAVGPACQLMWGRVDDERVVGYRFYVDGERSKELPDPLATRLSCADAGLKQGANRVHATAYGIGQESEPSNALDINFDTSPLAPPGTLRLTFTVEILP